LKGAGRDDGSEGLAAMAQAAMMTPGIPSLPFADEDVAVVALTVTYESLSEEVEVEKE